MKFLLLWFAFIVWTLFWGTVGTFVWFVPERNMLHIPAPLSVKIGVAFFSAVSVVVGYFVLKMVTARIS